MPAYPPKWLISLHLVAACLCSFLAMADEEAKKPEPPSTEADDWGTELRWMVAFRQGSIVCPEALAPLKFLGQVCPNSNIVYYYDCCEQNNQEFATCCFHLQPTTWLTIGLVLVLVLFCATISLLCGLLKCLANCLCCCCCLESSSSQNGQQYNYATHQQHSQMTRV